MAILEVT